MSSPSTDTLRIKKDVTELMESNHEVTILEDLNNILVKFYGPKGTPYEDGLWKVRVKLPEQYPFMPPQIQFVNMIYHPNITPFGMVCLDVIRHAWTESYTLTHIFEYFLPQLLTQPNPDDPIYSAAAFLYNNKPEEYKKKVLDWVRKYASEEDLKQTKTTESSDDEEENMDTT